MADGRDRRRLLVGGWLATAVTAVGVTAVVADPWSAIADGRIDLLVAVGLLCVAGLTVRRAPTVAWLSFIGAVLITCTAWGPSAVASREASGDPASWLQPALMVGATVVTAGAVALLYSTRAAVGRTGRLVAAVLWAWLCAAFALTIALGLAGTISDPAVSVRNLAVLPTTWTRPWIGAIALVGLLADLGPALGMTRARVALERAGPQQAIAIALDEASGRAGDRRGAAAAERRRLAGELHAEILPAVRATLDGVESGAPPGLLADSLRALADDLEALTLERYDVVLDTLGLVPALEALAERVEGRSGVVVALTIADGPATSQRPPAAAGLRAEGCPPTVAAVAHDISRLAIDNAIRHGQARRIELAIEETASSVSLSVRDDGVGIDPEVLAAPSRDSRMGLAEMRRQSAEVGGLLLIAPAPSGGTLVSFEWPGTAQENRPP